MFSHFYFCCSLSLSSLFLLSVSASSLLRCMISSAEPRSDFQAVFPSSGLFRLRLRHFLIRQVLHIVMVSSPRQWAASCTESFLVRFFLQSTAFSFAEFHISSFFGTTTFPCKIFHSFSQPFIFRQAFFALLSLFSSSLYPDFLYRRRSSSFFFFFFLFTAFIFLSAEYVFLWVASFLR